MTRRPTPPRWHKRARHALAHSLRVRLMALFVVLALALAGTFIFGMQKALSIGWRDAARPLLTDYVDRLAAEVGSPPSVERARAITARLPLSVYISGPMVNWRNHTESSAHADGDAFQKNFRNDWNSDEPRFLERTTADGHHIRFGLSVQAWENRPRFIGWATLAALLLLTALAYARVQRMLRPLADIRAGALRFGAGDFGQPIPVKRPGKPDELGELAATINTMGGDIHQMLEAKRALLLAISHELRSPLTRARLNTELLPETAQLQARRDALLQDLALMRDLVNDLLESERLAGRHAALQREPTDLAALAQEVIGNLDGAPAVQQRIFTGLPLLPLDRTRFRLLLRNLLDNALRHNQGAAQPPVLDIQRTASGGVCVTVQDFGAGVAPQDLPHLAEPFFRPDTARTRTEGGVGLGLYLCKLVALAHGGSFEVRNGVAPNGTDRQGLVVTVNLPAE